MDYIREKQQIELDCVKDFIAALNIDTASPFIIIGLQDYMQQALNRDWTNVPIDDIAVFKEMCFVRLSVYLRGALDRQKDNIFNTMNDVRIKNKISPATVVSYTGV